MISEWREIASQEVRIEVHPRNPPTFSFSHASDFRPISCRSIGIGRGRRPANASVELGASHARFGDLRCIHSSYILEDESETGGFRADRILHAGGGVVCLASMAFSY